LFIVLRGKLSAFELEVNDFLASHKLLGIKVVVSSVEKIVVDVQKWQQRVEDHFELLNRWPKPFKDPRAGNNKTAVGRVRLVNEAIFAATESTPDALDLTSKTLPQDIVALPNSPVKLFRATQQGLTIFEKKDVGPKIPEDKIESMKNDVIDLARVLSAEDVPNRGILRCKGYRYMETTLGRLTRRQFILEFEVPPAMANPRSLRDILLDKDFKGQVSHALNERFSLAKQVAKAVLHVHSKKHVHKNIRPDTILLFETLADGAAPNPSNPNQRNPKGFPVSLGTAFLVGFERVRKDEADTIPIEDTDWSENIYRHPSRQGPNHGEDKFNMLHDVYSLGVCLLEIAMWRSFIDVDAAGNKVNNVKACNLIEPGTSMLAKRLLSPMKIQEKFIRDAKKRVPIALGERFSQVVLRCLKCVETFAADAEHDPFIGLK
jgi:hypothetical protein